MPHWHRYTGAQKWVRTVPTTTKFKHLVSVSGTLNSSIVLKASIDGQEKVLDFTPEHHYGSNKQEHYF